MIIAPELTVKEVRARCHLLHYAGIDLISRDEKFVQAAFDAILLYRHALATEPQYVALLETDERVTIHELRSTPPVVSVFLLERANVRREVSVQVLALRNSTALQTLWFGGRFCTPVVIQKPARVVVHLLKGPHIHRCLRAHHSLICIRNRLDPFVVPYPESSILGILHQTVDTTLEG